MSSLKSVFSKCWVTEKLDLIFIQSKVTDELGRLMEPDVVYLVQKHSDNEMKTKTSRNYRVINAVK